MFCIQQDTTAVEQPLFQPSIHTSTEGYQCADLAGPSEHDLPAELPNDQEPCSVYDSDKSVNVK